MWYLQIWFYGLSLCKWKFPYIGGFLFSKEAMDFLPSHWRGFSLNIYPTPTIVHGFFVFRFYIPSSRFNILVERCLIFKNYGKNVVYYVNWCLKIHIHLPMKFQCMNVFLQVPLSILNGRNVCYCLFVLTRIIDKRMVTTLGISLDEPIT